MATYRSILRPLESSCPTWILHAECCNSAHSLHAYLVNMKVRDPDHLVPAKQNDCCYYTDSFHQAVSYASSTAAKQ